MTKQEFLAQLQAALNGGLGSKEAVSHVSYYQEYIEIEVRKGRREEEVISDLGSPKLIAHSIVDASKLPESGSARNDILFEYGKELKNKCADLCGEAFKKVRKWFKNL